MGFAASAKELDDACLAAFGLKADGVVVLFTPQDGSGAQQIDGIVKEPALEEDTLSPSVVRLFVRFTEITPSPKKGDLVSIDGRHYDVADVEVDPVGGSVLKLRVF